MIEIEMGELIVKEKQKTSVQQTCELQYCLKASQSAAHEVSVMCCCRNDYIYLSSNSFLWLHWCCVCMYNGSSISSTGESLSQRSDNRELSSGKLCKRKLSLIVRVCVAHTQTGCLLSKQI